MSAEAPGLPPQPPLEASPEQARLDAEQANRELAPPPESETEKTADTYRQRAYDSTMQDILADPSQIEGDTALSGWEEAHKRASEAGEQAAQAHKQRRADERALAESVVNRKYDFADSLANDDWNSTVRVLDAARGQAEQTGDWTEFDAYLYGNDGNGSLRQSERDRYNNHVDALENPEPAPPEPEPEPEPIPPAPQPEPQPTPPPEIPPANKNDDTLEIPPIKNPDGIDPSRAEPAGSRRSEKPTDDLDPGDDDIDLRWAKPVDLLEDVFDLDDLDDPDLDPSHDDGSAPPKVYRGGKHVKENFLPEAADSYTDGKVKAGDKPYVTLPIPKRVNRRNTLSVEGSHATAREKIAGMSDEDLVGLKDVVARKMFPSERDYRRYTRARQQAEGKKGEDRARRGEADPAEAERKQRRQERRERLKRTAQAISRFSRAMGITRPESYTAKRAPLRERISRRLGAFASQFNVATQPREPGAPGAGNLPPRPLTEVERTAWERELNRALDEAEANRS